MPKLLPRLRYNLDFLPSPLSDRPGLLIRDPLQFSDATLIIPPPLVPCLEYFDGQHTDIELRSYLVRLTGDLQVGMLIDHLTESLGQAAFFDDAEYARQRKARLEEFALATHREAAHAGSAYPNGREALTTAMNRYLESPDGDAVVPRLGIAAPHVSPEGGWKSYSAAYRAAASLGESGREKTFVVLGTSHYGAPEKFGLTRKPFVTPYGETVPALSMIDHLASAAPDAVVMEDYAHAIEHSIEFQVVFLQHLFGPDIRVLPILCGPYVQSLQNGGRPEDHEQVRRFLGELGELAATKQDELFWILGVDMAHIGIRYGDGYPVRANEGQMTEVANRDEARIQKLLRGDPDSFWELVQDKQDDLKWCGSSPLYTFLKAVPHARGSLLNYEQWNIDDHSVVSFAALSF